MRPVNRGDIPKDNNEAPIIFTEYSDARDALISRIGDYCSYCESPLLAPAVEHIQPKSKEPALEKDWNNFLLACTFCNSVKKDKPINTANFHSYFWADADNTFRAFIYEKDRSPQIDPSLTHAQQQIACETLGLTGLDREPSHPFLTKKDRRWIKRNEAWMKAETAKNNLDQQPTDLMRRQIIDTATSTGFWSVWMTVFVDDIDMRSLLIEAFPNTCPSCFDSTTQTIQRPGGQI
ncbi:HNH endonuclease [Methylomonas albis]|uniref:HNH endonuclease n=1 Tax=Methylomonas albis TaxID=1854563 RepID=A0ABR9D5I7_9GAMM|nr:HNH endonuclease [Methylomonas albis]MBD9357533.1 HNH endonuclease [Methylomonas albis]